MDIVLQHQQGVKITGDNTTQSANAVQKIHGLPQPALAGIALEIISLPTSGFYFFCSSVFTEHPASLAKPVIITKSVPFILPSLLKSIPA